MTSPDIISCCAAARAKHLGQNGRFNNRREAGCAQRNTLILARNTGHFFCCAPFVRRSRKKMKHLFSKAPYTHIIYIYFEVYKYIWPLFLFAVCSRKTPLPIRRRLFFFVRHLLLVAVPVAEKNLKMRFSVIPYSPFF